MAPTGAASSFDGKVESFANFAQTVALWSRASDVDVSKRAPAVVLHMDPVARDVWMAVRSEQLSELGGATEITQALRDSVAPEAIDSVLQEVAHFRT